MADDESVFICTISDIKKHGVDITPHRVFIPKIALICGTK